MRIMIIIISSKYQREEKREQQTTTGKITPRDIIPTTITMTRHQCLQLKAPLPHEGQLLLYRRVHDLYVQCLAYTQTNYKACVAQSQQVMLTVQ